MMLTIFSMCIGYLYIFFEEIDISDLLNIFQIGSLFFFIVELYELFTF